MLANSLQTSENMIFDGTVSPTAALGVGFLLATIVAWLMWRERLTVGPRLAGQFWLLRMTAIAMALWMLSGPMRETVERETVTQSITILADVSQSMETVDAPGTSGLLRWMLASEGGDAKPTVLSHIDNAKVAVRFAKFASEKAARLLREHQPLKQFQQSLEETRTASERAQQHCRQLITQLNEGELREGGEELADRVGRVKTLLQGPIALGLTDLQELLAEKDTMLVSRLTDALEVLGDNLSGASRRIDLLTKKLAKQLADEETVDTKKIGDLTRREMTTNVLDALQKNVLDDFATEVRIRKFQFDGMLTPIAPERTWSEAAKLVSSSADAKQQPSTDLSVVFKQLSNEQAAESTCLAFLLTDGKHTAHSAQTPLEVAAQFSGLPVFPVPIGNSLLVRDLRIHRVEAPSSVVENDTTLVEAIVTAVDCDGLVTDVTLRHDGQEIDRQTVAFVGNRVDRRVQFTVPAKQIGWQDYELTVEPMEEEQSVANNVAPVSWEVIRDKVRVLLADGISQWEFRYLQQLFRRDSHIQCDELLFYPRLRGTGELANNPRLPERVDDWAVYDVVILGDLDAKHFSTASQKALTEYVRHRQGHLILLAGRDHMPREYYGKPLLDLLPVTASSFNMADEGYTLMLTDEGRMHSALAIEDSAQASEAAWVSVYRKASGG